MNSPRNPKIQGPARAESGPNWTLRQEVSVGLVQECARGWSCQRMPKLAGVLPGLRLSPVKSYFALHQRRQAWPVADWPEGGWVSDFCLVLYVMGQLVAANAAKV